MRPIRAGHATGNRLRFVFDDAVVSYNFAGLVTFEEIAATLGELSPHRYHDPIAIDVTMGFSEH